MPNHFHLLIYIKCDTDRTTSSHPTSVDLNKSIGILLRSYTRALQKKVEFTGSLFQQKTKARVINKSPSNRTSNDVLVCMNYIHQNPLKAKLVNSTEDWEFSSYRDYAGLRQGTLCDKNLGFYMTGLTKEDFTEESQKTTEDPVLKEWL